MNKQQWISAKIAKLIGEGRNQQQAITIAYSMWEQGGNKDLPEMQFGGAYDYSVPDASFRMSTPTSLNTTKDSFSLNYQAPQFDIPQVPASMMGQFQPSPEINSEAGFKEQYSQENMNKRASTGVLGAEPSKGEGENQDWVKYNILNPYGQGMDLGTSLAYTGQQFGKGNTGMGIAGAGLSALKGVRSFMSGYGSGKGERNVQDQMREDLYNSDEKLYQFGGITFDEEMLNNIQPNIDLPAQAQSPEWISRMGDSQVPQATQEVPAAIAAAQVAVEEVKNKNFDSASASDTWTQKTGLPWSEAKRLGYTDGTAKDNIKLLGELNDKRFNKDNLRSKPFTAPKQAAKTQAAEVAKVAKIQDYFNSAEFKALPKSKKVKAQAKAIEESGITDIIGKIGEVLGNPLQSFGEYAKYGKLPSSGFSKNNTNALDDVLGLINPANWANHAGNAVDYADQGDYENAGKEALGALPAAGKFLKTVKYVPYLPGLPAAGGTTSRTAGYLGQGAARLQPGAQKVFPIYNGARRGAEYVSGSYRPYEEGGFTQGEEYDLTEEEVQDLISKGYKIKYKE
jgi:hypothetical protein